MNIEKQVCTVEQAIKLKELGVDQSVSLGYWFFGDTGTNQDHFIVRNKPSDGQDSLCASAYTVGELGVMLGKEALKDHLQDDEPLNEAIDRANDLICLLEHDEYSPEMVNNRLTL